MKVLLIGFDEVPERRVGEQLDTWSKEQVQRKTGASKLIWESRVSVFDYDVVFLNAVLPPPRLVSDLVPFLLDGGVLCVFVSGANAQCINPFVNANANHSGNSIVYEGGSPIEWVRRLLCRSEFKFGWSAILKRGDHAGDFLQIAFSPNRKCVCSLAQVGNGRVLAMPSPVENISALLRKVLDGVKSNLVREEERPSVPPWADTIFLPGEEALLMEVQKIEGSLVARKKKLSDVRKPKEVLYLGGGELSKAVWDVFTRMGIDATLKEELRREDLQIEFGELLGLVEVKGLKAHADVDDLRQLQDWWINAGGLSSNIKGLFVVNHYRNVEPDAREEPYTPDALELGRRNEFCLMTTVDLLAMYRRHVLGEESAQKSVKRMFDTRGLFSIMSHSPDSRES